MVTRAVYPPELDWAACGGHDPELFFPETQSDLEQARLICSTCPAAPVCRDLAVRRARASSGHSFWGVWGGVFYRAGHVIDRIRPLGRPPTGTDGG